MTHVDANTVVLAVIAVATAFNTIAGKVRDRTLGRIETIGQEVHKLTNGNMTASLRSNVAALKSAAVALRAMARMTKQKGDVVAAVAADKAVTAAEQVLAEHIKGEKFAKLAKDDVGK